MDDACHVVPDDASCLHCGYALRGLPGTVCPECGCAFDPEDSDTYRNSATPSLRRRYGGPPRRWHRYIILAVTLLTILDTSAPGMLIPYFCVYLPLGLVLLIVVAYDYVVRLCFALIDWREGGSCADRTAAKGSRGRWLVTPLCLVLIITAVWYPWPAYVRFRLSRPAFERVAQGGTVPNGGRLVGLYWVQSVDRYDNKVMFFETGDSLLDQSGIMYRPTSQPIQDAELFPRYHLTGSWYTAELSW